ncbi:hypothetical protein Acr_02g0014480 [Actinidia rufa]|uniref:Uncharacterized protein n=1 Tax=Actinidia rufa TaxID=165716 RepID=A0A7J0E9R2_9ERIC|nr:hypothetical protein Acr_02g0014480 [Actinidia rufa]
MAEVKNDEEQLQQHEHTLPEKRKPDLTSVDENKDEIGIENGAENESGNSKKKQKSEFSAHDTIFPSVAEEKEIDDDDDDDDEDEDDKGKGKMIEESDDTSDGLDDSDGDSSDLSDDPLAEVDLDNILPSRTRGRVHRPGVHISDDLGNNVDDDRDDSDANCNGSTMVYLLHGLDKAKGWQPNRPLPCPIPDKGRLLPFLPGRATTRLARCYPNVTVISPFLSFLMAKPEVSSESFTSRVGGRRYNVLKQLLRCSVRVVKRWCATIGGGAMKGLWHHGVKG